MKSCLDRKVIEWIKEKMAQQISTKQMICKENLKTRKGYSNVLAKSIAQPQFSMRIKPMYT